MGDLSRTIWRDECFDKLLGDPATDMYTVMNPDIFSDWLSLAKGEHPKAFENHSAMWFRTFTEQIKPKALSMMGLRPSGCTTPLAGIYLRDACHGAQRKRDMVLTRKLDNQTPPAILTIGCDYPGGNVMSRSSMVVAMNPVVISPVVIPPVVMSPVVMCSVMMCSVVEQPVFRRPLSVIHLVNINTRGRTSWSLARSIQTSKRTWRKAQPGRRFVYAFTVYGHLARFCFFDRMGASISTSYDISSKQGQTLFMHGLLSYMKMAATQLGFDERYKDNEGNPFRISPFG